MIGRVVLDVSRSYPSIAVNTCTARNCCSVACHGCRCNYLLSAFVIVPPHRRFSQNNRNAATVLIYRASPCKFAPTEINLYGKTNLPLTNRLPPSVSTSRRLLSFLSSNVCDVSASANNFSRFLLDAKLKRVCNCVIRIDNCPTLRLSQHWQRKDLVMSQPIILLS